MPQRYRLLAFSVLLLVLFILSGGSPVLAFGPFDYTNPEHRARHLDVVERYHFNLEVESLQAGISSSVWGDLDYTLRAFPNHHRALAAMTRLLSLPDPGYRLLGKPFDRTIEYYFDQAMRFAPHDGTVRLIYGIHFHQGGEYDKALDEYQAALERVPQSADLQYNLGLLYSDMRQYDKAVSHARRAYELGHPLPGLREKLRQAGVWQEN